MITLLEEVDLAKKSNRLKTARNINFASGIVNEIGSFASSLAQASAVQGDADYQMTLATINNRFASIESRDIIKTADKRATEHSKNVKSLIGSQKVAFAGGNVLVGDGTSAEIETQTREIGFEEQRNIRNNAWKQAFGVRQQASSQLLAAQNAKASADFQARTTLISGAIGAIGGVVSSVSSFSGGGFDPSSYGKKGN